MHGPDILYPSQGHRKFLKHLVRLAMQTRAPAWCEIDRKRLLRHTACCFLLLPCASRGEPHGATYSPSATPPSVPLILHSLPSAHPNLPYHIIPSESRFTFTFPTGAFFLTSNWLLCAYCWNSMGVDVSETLQFRDGTSAVFLASCASLRLKHERSARREI